MIDKGLGIRSDHLLEGRSRPDRPQNNQPENTAGGILSTLLFVILYSKISSIFLDTTIKIVQYVDDICFYTSNKDRNAALENLKSVYICYAFAQSRGHKIYPSKSLISYFTKKEA